MNTLASMIKHGCDSLKKEETWLGICVLLSCSVSPNIFPAAQAGMANMLNLALWLLIPSIVFLILIVTILAVRVHTRLFRRVWVGALCGLIATIGLEIIRYTSFVLGGMPGNLPRLMGVLITDTFMQGPSFYSDFAGWSYHFWNGACFGMIYTVLLGKKSWWVGIIYGVVIGIGFLVSPAVKSLGIGFMGMDMPAMPFSVILAHIVYGGILGILSAKWLYDRSFLLWPDRD